jgi:hypothetical protein
MTWNATRKFLPWILAILICNYPILMRNYSFPDQLFNKIDSQPVFNDLKDFFTDGENKLAGLIVIFVGDVKPEITATANSETLTATGAGDAFIAGTFAIARSADKTGDRGKPCP